MRWVDLEKSFHRAFLLSLSRRKWVLTFPALALCGVLAIFCHAMAYEAGEWVTMSAAFLPILLSSSILLALGVLLVRIHYYEAKQLHVPLKKLFSDASSLLFETASLSVPSILIYLCLWIFLGFFLLLREVPFIGEFFSVVFSFGPFLILLGSLFLCIFNLGLLFFATPAAAFQPIKGVSLLKRISKRLTERLLSALALFLVALLPSAVLSGLLTGAAKWTDVRFTMAERSLSIAFEWFFIMLPFCALLTPAVIFFFNFAAESYQLLQLGLPSNPSVKQNESQCGSPL